MKKLVAMLYAGIFLSAVVVALYVLLHGIELLEGLAPILGG